MSQIRFAGPVLDVLVMEETRAVCLYICATIDHKVKRSTSGEDADAGIEIYVIFGLVIT